MVRAYIIIGIACVILLSPACGKGEALVVFAAASLQDAFTELQPAAEKACERSIAYTFAGSGILYQQLKDGAVADVLVSSSIYYMDLLAEKIAIVQDSRIAILGNTLTVIGQPGTAPAIGKAALRGLLDAASNFAIGNPRFVSLGRYTENVLRELELTRSTNGRVLLGDSGGQVVQFAETGAAQYGFVFGSDAKISGDRGKSSIVYRFSDAEMGGESIIYMAAVLGSAPRKSPARKFVEFLRNEEARYVFINEGFRIP
ncbi:MAG: molybdate ABC transporter substrate-binding protein [Spirochaetota bacterium]|jgi:molybdate transport system substrate-binding protein|nr:molybdate ABC transporter substrate-binding protein [Spirochaetota bacterium]